MNEADYTHFVGCLDFKFRSDAGYGSSLPIEPSLCCSNCIHWDWSKEHCKVRSK